jgi:DNA-binding beta-propeller fold protein YncE
VLTSTVSNVNIFTFDEAYAAPQFDGPDGVAIDSSGNVFVADTSNHRIQKFTNTGKFIRKWGSLGSGNGQFNFPAGVAIDSSGNVFVADLGNDRIQKFTNTGKFIRKWGSEGSVSIDVTGASPPDQKLSALTGFASPFG